MYWLAGSAQVMYDRVTFETLCNMHLGLSKLLKKYVIAFMSSERLRTRSKVRMDGSQTFLSIRKAFLLGVKYSSVCRT